MKSIEHIILVNQNNKKVGTMEKHEAHKKGLLHRAFSVFIWNDNNEMLLQRRANSKYHSGGLWSNACCSHPKPNEKLNLAVKRRLKEELGIECVVKFKFSFVYKANLDRKMIEHELDFVYFGKYNGKINPNPEEVKEIKWISKDKLEHLFQTTPEIFTAWFYIIYKKYKQESIFNKL